MRKHKRYDGEDMLVWFDWLCISLAGEKHKWTWRERTIYNRIVRRLKKEAE